MKATRMLTRELVETIRAYASSGPDGDALVEVSRLAVIDLCDFWLRGQPGFKVGDAVVMSEAALRMGLFRTIRKRCGRDRLNGVVVGLSKDGSPYVKVEGSKAGAQRSAAMFWDKLPAQGPRASG